jgi:F-type H+-transporting ATPase subunit b
VNGHPLLLAAERKGIDLILPATAELVWGIICFAVVAFLLIRFAFPRIKETIEARERAIQGSHEEAERARDEAKALLDDYKRQLAEARSESNRIIEEGRQSAEQVRKDLVSRAETDAEGIVARARDQIQQERQRTIQELQSQIGAMSIELAEKVVGRSLDGQTQRELVDAYINQVASMGATNGGSPNGGATG